MIESTFQFINNRIISLNIKNNTINFNSVDLKIELSHIDYHISSNEEIDNGFFGTLILEVTVKAKAKRKNVFSLDLSLEGAFQGEKGDDLDHDKFTQMLELNGSTTLFSIARTIIITTSAMCSIDGQIRIPLINMMQLYQEKHIKNN